MTEITVGVDVVSVKRVEELISNYPGARERLFTDAEIAYAESKARPADHLAARFAAKEAVFKSVGQGWPFVSWKEVEVVSTSSAPEIRVTGRVRELAGDGQFSLSLAHDAGVAIAQVILQRSSP